MFSTLIDRYKSLRGNIEDGRPDAKLNHNYLSLYQVQRDHRFLEVTIDGDDVVYQSIILELEPEERTILIDEFFPNDFVGLPGQRVSVAVRLDGGRKMQFKTDIVEKYLHEGKVLMQINPDFYRPAEVELLWGNSSKARIDLGWKPKSSFLDLVKKMVDHDLAHS